MAMQPTTRKRLQLHAWRKEKALMMLARWYECVKARQGGESIDGEAARALFEAARDLFETKTDRGSNS